MSPIVELPEPVELTHNGVTYRAQDQLGNVLLLGHFENGVWQNPRPLPDHLLSSYTEAAAATRAQGAEVGRFFAALVDALGEEKDKVQDIEAKLNSSSTFRNRVTEKFKALNERDEQAKMVRTLDEEAANSQGQTGGGQPPAT